MDSCMSLRSALFCDVPQGTVVIPYTHTQTHTHRHIHTPHTHTDTYTDTDTYTPHTHTHTHTHTYTPHTHTHTNTQTHTHTHKHTQTHIHTHTHKLLKWALSETSLSSASLYTSTAYFRLPLTLIRESNHGIVRLCCRNIWMSDIKHRQGTIIWEQST